MAHEYERRFGESSLFLLSAYSIFSYQLTPASLCKRSARLAAAWRILFHCSDCFRFLSVPLAQRDKRSELCFDRGHSLHGHAISLSRDLRPRLARGTLGFCLDAADSSLHQQNC